jgi:signal transduction histidine kinase
MGMEGGKIDMKPQTQILAPEMLVPRIGDYLVDRGFITYQDLKSALLNQHDPNNIDNHNQLLGKILIDMGKIDQATLDQAVTEQIKNWKDAIEQSNFQLEMRVKQRTAELEQALKKINELNQLKANFISNISHELRTPLTHLKGYLDLLITGDMGSLQKDQMQVLNIMQRASGRLERLIEDLILFTFAEHDEVIISREKFDLGAITSEVIKDIQILSPSRKVDLIIQPQDQFVWVDGDQKKIAWVINHLIENAIKFSEPNSELKVKIDTGYKSANLSVIDQGIGIEQEKLEEIFEPFHQLDGSSTRRYGGVGLGLALCKKIIEAHNSKLNVQSRIGIGSKFDFSLKRLIE